MKKTDAKKLDAAEQIVTIIIIMCLAFILLSLLMYYDVNNETNESEDTQEETIEHQMTERIYKVEQNEVVHVVVNYEPSTKDLCYAAQKEIEGKLYEFSYTEDVMQWYVEYKELVDRHAWLLGQPKRIYDEYSKDEIYLIQRAVETETYQCYFLGKANVASVILNRISDGRFGKSIKEIITNPGQFAWHRTKISESTILAVEFAYDIGDTTDGCIAFRSDRKPEKWGKWTYQFSDNSVHHFYK